MRAAPPVHVSVTRFRVWRTGVGGVLAIVWLTVSAWAASQGMARGGVPSAPVACVALIALAAATVLAVRLVVVPAFDLRWDGRCWTLGGRASTPASSDADDPRAGDIVVSVDLGDWLLLRFVPERSAKMTAGVPCWLPLQRSGLEPAWHALRCAVHSPRVVADSTDAAVG